MKRGWTEVALGEVLRREARPVEVIADQTYREIGIRSHGKGIFHKNPLSGLSLGDKRVFWLKPGDFVLNIVFAWEGAVGAIGEAEVGMIGSHRFPTFRTDDSCINLRFLVSYFRTRDGLDLLGRVSPGGAGRNRTLSQTAFLNQRIPLPPLAEQQRIAARLDAIETRLNRVQQLREEQTQQLQAALRSAFHRLVANADWKRLAEVAPLAWRQVEIQPEASYTEFGVRSFYKGIFLRRKVPGSVFDWQELYRLKAGDIVFSNIMAWEKAIAVAGAEHDGWVGNHRMLICEPRQDIVSASCLFHYFMTEEGFAKILKASPGTAARNKTLKADRLMEIEVPVPPLPAQREFQKLLALQAQVGARATESESAANALLPSLLDQVFSS